MSPTRYGRSSFHRAVLIAVSAAVVIGCGGARPAEPKSSAETAKPATVVPAPGARPPLLPPEQSLTSAELVLLTEEPLFAGELGDMFSLGAGQAAFLAKGKRAIATLSGVRTIGGPGPLETICRADDRKTFFAVGNSANDYAAQVYRSESFEGTLAPLGKRLTHRYTNARDRAWIVSDDNGTFHVECASARVTRIGDAAKGADQLYWTDAITALRLTREKGAQCVVRAADRWLELPACDARLQGDGSMLFETRYDSQRPTAKARCLKVISAAGKEIPCGSKIGPPVNWSSPPVPPTAWGQARYFAPRRVALAASDGAVIEVTSTPIPASARRISPPDLVACNPLLATAPLFRCRTADGTAVVARVDRDGTFREELRRTFGTDEYQTFHVTVDGGVAVGGTCEGALEQAACVRRPDGTFHTVRFSPELVTALTRTAPMTKLVPTRDGELYVGIGTLEGGLTGRIAIKLFKADAGPGVSVENIPTWMLGSLANFGEMIMLGGSGGIDLSEAFSLGFSRADSIRIWPFERLHPAFRTREQCRVDLTLEGQFDVACEQGHLRAIGRVGLLQKRPQELFETLDAGGTWTKVSLPSGLEVEGVHCTALGCHLGPYFRRGWGEPSRTAPNTNPG